MKSAMRSRPESPSSRSKARSSPTGCPIPKTSRPRFARKHGAVPATCAIIGGELHAGLTDEQIHYLGYKGAEVRKVSRRDIPYVMAKGEDGATTVAATMFIAHLAGIKVFATGGIGGVHRGAETTMDISADLNELGRTPVAVVCAGPKSVLDIGLTLEYLETQGVPVIAFRSDNVPAFYTRDSGFKAPCRADTVEELSNMVCAMDGLGMQSGMVIVNPIPENYEMDPDKIDKATIKAVKESEKQHITGRDVTPFLLKRIAELTNNASLDANIALVYNNVRLAALVAAGMHKTEE